MKQNLQESYEIVNKYRDKVLTSLAVDSDQNAVKNNLNATENVIFEQVDSSIKKYEQC